MRLCRHSYEGRVGYAEAAALQESCARLLKDGGRVERLLLLEHPPVITLGRNARSVDVLHDQATLESLGVEVRETNRGGQVTYHGPGQLVGYPILDLSPDRRDVARYLRDLEEVLIRALAAFGVTAGRVPGLTGVWVGSDKIASIGVHLSRWVTTHGFALNVNTDLARFGLIVPCGLRGGAVTSMQRLLGRATPLEEVAAAIVPVFGEVFGREMEPPSLPGAIPAQPALTEVA
ncbi:MAG TPA: lipoyl(octanoyl) transferase LipB [Candidatus Polarisedimenticolia bacterium]|jgi:lipoyl(octanoyl) transferase|nr:lipoyl(octanoyl) transferase LipB [Candidatus Polarisedimenticolia bacterium]